MIPPLFTETEPPGTCLELVSYGHRIVSQVLFFLSLLTVRPVEDVVFALCQACYEGIHLLSLLQCCYTDSY